MKLDSSLAGSELRDFSTSISWRDTMNYAAAINDRSDFYLNDERESGIIAPPMYSVAVTWNILGKIWEYVDTNAFPIDVIATQVHYTEYLEFHRPMYPGDELTIKGKIAAIEPHRSGTYVVIRFDALDNTSNPVFIEYMGGLMRGVKCVGEGQGGADLPVIPGKPGKGSEPRWQSTVPIAPLQPYIYDGCTDIFFPIHTSPKFAHQVGLPGIILQGTATLAFAIREMINREAAGDPRRLKRLYCRFTGMVIPGTDIVVRSTGESENERSTNHFFDVLNHHGKTALSDGFVEIIHT